MHKNDLCFMISFTTQIEKFSFDTFISSTHRSSAQQYDFSTLIFQFPFDALILFLRLPSVLATLCDCFYSADLPTGAELGVLNDSGGE